MFISFTPWCARYRSFFLFYCSIRMMLFRCVYAQERAGHGSVTRHRERAGAQLLSHGSQCRHHGQKWKETQRGKCAQQTTPIRSYVYNFNIDLLRLIGESVFTVDPVLFDARVCRWCPSADALDERVQSSVTSLPIWHNITHRPPEWSRWVGAQ